MQCLSEKCEHNLECTCSKENVVRGNEKCDKLSTNLDCIMCDLNEINKCDFCSRDWNEVAW